MNFQSAGLKDETELSTNSQNCHKFHQHTRRFAASNPLPNDGSRGLYSCSCIQKIRSSKPIVVNPFLANAPILYPLKTAENFWFSGVFRGYKMETLARNGLMEFAIRTIETIF